MTPSKQFTIKTILVVACAAILSSFIYWYVLVPQLPRYLRVPVIWWVGIYAPFGCAALCLGFYIQQMRHIPFYGAVAALTVNGVDLVITLVSGRPPGHDMAWVDMLDPFQVLLALVFLIIQVMLFSMVMYSGYLSRMVVRRVSAG